MKHFSCSDGILQLLQRDAMRKEKEEMDFLFYIVYQRQKIKHLPFMDKIKPFDNFPIKLVLCRKHQTIRRLRLSKPQLYKSFHCIP